MSTGLKSIIALILFSIAGLNSGASEVAESVPSFPVNEDETRPAVQRINYNEFYKFPVSVGLSGQFFSPLNQFGTDYKGRYSVVDLSAVTRYPVPGLPWLQPFLKFGAVLTRAQFDSRNTNASNFDNDRYYISLGLQAVNKVNKGIEWGGSLEAGFGYRRLEKLDPTEEKVLSSFDMHVAFGPNLVFNPSFNYSINVHPTIGYNLSFTPLKRFNGFYFGFGINLDYRFGRDPDQPSETVQSIEFSNPRIDNFFAAMQSYYVNFPFGEITITNIESFTLENVEVSFYQPGYMSVPGKIASIKSLRPGQSEVLPITALLDQGIFDIEGIIPLTGQIAVEFSRGRIREMQATTIDYDLYDKNSITWDDDNKLGAFITSGDSALSNYLSYLNRINKDFVNTGYNEPLQKAIQVYYGLTEVGILYQKDPVQSYENIRGKVNYVDTVNLPRETLSKLAGDCDDLTVLFNALLESAGVETGFITAPGHIYSMFNTGMDASDYAQIHPDKSLTIPFDGKLWVPVEITYIGEFGFDQAWISGAEEFNRYIDEGKIGIFFTREAQKNFRPVGFRQSDLGVQYGDSSRINQDFSQELEKQIGLVISDFEKKAYERNTKGAFNQLGIISAGFGRYGLAEQAISQALALDRNYQSAKVNLGNVYFLREEYQNALRIFHEVEEEIRNAGGTSNSLYFRILLNLAQSYFELEIYPEAADYFKALAAVNPGLAERYSYLSDSAGEIEEEFTGDDPDIISGSEL